MKKLLFLLVTFLFINHNTIVATNRHILPSTNEVGFHVGAGGGIGLAYGNFGFRGAFRYNQFEASAGIGIMPIAWDAVTSFSGTYMFDIKSKIVIPKITIVTSSRSASVLLYDQEDFSILYKAYYPGVAPYFGMYLSFNEKQKFLIDFSIGYVVTLEGNRNVVQNFKDQKKKFEQIGYTFSSPLINSMYLPKVSFGMIFFL